MSTLPALKAPVWARALKLPPATASVSSRVALTSVTSTLASAMSALAQLRAALSSASCPAVTMLPVVRMWALDTPSMRALASEALPPMMDTATELSEPLLPTTAFAPVSAPSFRLALMLMPPMAVTFTALAAPPSGWPM